MQILAGYVSLGMLIAHGSTIIYADENERVLAIRAVSEPSPQIARLIDKIAEPIIVKPDQGATLRQTITQHCGSISPAYIDLLQETSDPIPLDQPLDQGEIKLPACLYYSSSKAPEITVRKGDNAFDLYRMRTGGGGTEKEIAEYFQSPVDSLRNLQIGKKLPAPSITLPVTLLARPGSEALLTELRQLDPQGTAFREPPVVQGEIVMGVPTSEIAARGDCDSPSEPLNGEAIYQAYVFSKNLARSDEINVEGGRANLAIVDNGFFGALPVYPISKAFEGSPFKSRYFKSDSVNTIAATFTLGGMQPINYTYEVKPTPDSGHGTHVTGIALGGPQLKPYLEKLDDDPWVSVTTLNIGRGEKTLVKGAYELMISNLLREEYQIVNLSITHDGTTNTNIKDIYNNLFRTAKSTLFVVAAGNNWGADVANKGILPAALGGTKNPNVITVAAIDGKHKLTNFSNIGVNSVDMAAPGCQISSWIANTNEITVISGTSQATPAITNGTALQLSLAVKASPETLKNRAISSGDLLPESERGKTVYEVSSNPARSLLMFQDYLDVEDGALHRTLLGSIQNMTPITCPAHSSKDRKNIKDMFSLKRTEGISYFFGGMLAGSIDRPCVIADDSKAVVNFSATHEISSDGRILKLPAVLEKSWLLRDVTNLVVRTPVNELL
ncbi:S8 family serine peptidase [Pseudomonas sp. Irchel s3f10]|uniref:S8 family serine peptidase n=1 Tax=Pseudomonas sp. Irchel s3f10 TaxID=2009137 RepID=UPI000BA3D0CF|nr:S8 family serine peptidase [Pseudomonas sp. Irchel s3f10]